MNVRVHDSLTGVLPHVHSQVIPVRVQSGVQLCVGFLNQVKRSFTFLLSQIKKAINMAEGDD
jgi:hypothetical protein